MIHSFQSRMPFFWSEENAVGEASMDFALPVAGAARDK
jgi:hypothetical protein